MMTKIAGRTLPEWIEFARHDDCFNLMVPSELRQLIGQIPMWKPIETAPKDGTRILVDFGNKVGVHTVAWEENVAGTTIWSVDDGKHGPYPLRGYMEADVKGWMPLPISRG